LSLKKEKVTVFAAGCFNRVHNAHRLLLQTARSLGDELVVVLSNDTRNKKPNAVPSAQREQNLRNLGLADRVIVGRPDSFVASLREVKPRILVLGFDQKLPDRATEDAVRELGVEVVVLPWFPGQNETCSAG
jgi:FAD synthetase